MEIIVGSFLDPSSFKGKPLSSSSVGHANLCAGFTTVIFMLGNHAMVHQPAIIDAAVSAGVTNFYPSEFGSDISQGADRSNRYFRDQHITRDHLTKTAEEHKGVGYTLIINGGFAEYAAHPAFGVNPGNGTFEFYGSKETREPFTGVKGYVDIVRMVWGPLLTCSNSVVKYTVASVLMLESNVKAENPCRTFRIPTAI